MRRCRLTLLALIAAGALGQAQAAPWPRYTDARLGWSIGYPPHWIVNPKFVSVSLGPDHNIDGVSFAIPGSFQPGTNLSHDNTTLSVESVPGANCKASQFVAPAEHVHVLRADGRIYTAATSEDAGAGNRYETLLFVLNGTSPCIAVRYVIHSTAFENYDPGTIRRFDRAKLIAAFDAIRATLTLGK